MLFDIIVPSYNNLEELKSCLSALEHQTIKDFNVIVCIDGSEDGTLEYLQAAHYTYQFIYFTHPDNKNHGRSANRNLAIPFLKADYTLLLDSDLNPRTDMLARHADLLLNQEVVSIGEVEYLNKKKNIWADYQSSVGKSKYTHGSEIPGKYFNSQNAAMKTKYFVALSGFDENFKIWGGEDTEFGYRLEKTGWVKFIYNKKAKALTVLDKTFDEGLKQLYEFGKFNFLYIIEKHPDFKDIYRRDLFLNKGIVSFFLKFILSSQVSNLSQKLYLFPGRLKNKILSLAALSEIYKGYWSNK